MERIRSFPQIQQIPLNYPHTRTRTELDAVGRETLESLAARDCASARYILKKVAVEGSDIGGAGRVGGWTESGEFVYRGRVVKGSHLRDLLKHLTSSFKNLQHTRLGWSSFLNLSIQLYLYVFIIYFDMVTLNKHHTRV